MTDDDARIAYTVGLASSYDRDLTSGENNIKLGRSADYPGGWVWKTPEEAQEFLSTAAFAKAFPLRRPSEFAVYQLELAGTYASDVSALPHHVDGVHRLLVTARIVARHSPEALEEHGIEAAEDSST